MLQMIEVPIQGMDCTDCTLHVQRAISQLPGVRSVDVFLGTEKAAIQLDTRQVSLADIRKAVEEAGYSMPDAGSEEKPNHLDINRYARQLLALFTVIIGMLLFIVVAGEWLGLFKAITEKVPWSISLAFIALAGYPVFRNVIRATLRRQVISHTLMTVGVLAAMVVGEWATAAVVVLLMRVGNFVERFTTEHARRAVKDLTKLAPQTARLETDTGEVEVPASEVHVGDIVVIRPGEKISVDGEVLSGWATIDESAITGESLPVEVGPGMKVYSATVNRLGSLRVRATHVGRESTFGRVIKLVEEAEIHKADVQRAADKFSSYYLPVVAGIAVLTYFIRREPLAAAAVLVVACSCSFALATPIAMLASIGASAKRGLLIKGGKYLETLHRADVLLIDKTGTLTLGKPQITDIILPGEDGYETHPIKLEGKERAQLELLQLAASIERYSEHPLAEALRQSASQHGLLLREITDFENVPGMGVRARIDGKQGLIGNRRMVEAVASDLKTEFQLNLTHRNRLFKAVDRLEAQGKTILMVFQDGEPAGLLAAQDTLRQDVPEAIAAVYQMGIKHVELLTGDNERATASLVNGEMGSPLTGVDYRAGLMPEDKIAIVRDYQAKGHTVVMIGDGINDAPALAQADIGIAMGAAGTDIAIEAAHIVLMRDDWRLVPEVFRIARRTMRVVRLNIAFTTVYNLLGITLAALGFLPPIFAAAAQSLPDFGILANSSRLLRQR
jgi:Cd2+/Zn2+-exporting ATPase/Cu+-exporting ATPase